MPPNTAVLIQCIIEYITYIKPYVSRILVNDYFIFKDKEREIIEWIIAEELELVYGLFVADHKHNHEPYALIHNRLTFMLPRNISTLTRDYIKAPHLYSDNNMISVKLTELDLYIYYYSSIQGILL